MSLRQQRLHRGRVIPSGFFWKQNRNSIVVAMSRVVVAVLDDDDDEQQSTSIPYHCTLYRMYCFFFLGWQCHAGMAILVAMRMKSRKGGSRGSFSCDFSVIKAGIESKGKSFNSDMCWWHWYDTDVWYAWLWLEYRALQIVCGWISYHNISWTHSHIENVYTNTYLECIS